MCEASPSLAALENAEPLPRPQPEEQRYRFRGNDGVADEGNERDMFEDAWAPYRPGPSSLRSIRRPRATYSNAPPMATGTGFTAGA